MREADGATCYSTLRFADRVKSIRNETRPNVQRISKDERTQAAHDALLQANAQILREKQALEVKVECDSLLLFNAP
jgi:hypothetical protein